MQNQVSGKKVGDIKTNFLSFCSFKVDVMAFILLIGLEEEDCY